MESIEQQLLEFIAMVYDAMGWPGVVTLMAIESVFFPIPSEAVMPLAGWLLVSAKGHTVSYVFIAGFYGAIGSVIGSLLIYGIGMKGGRPFVERYGRYFLITQKDLDKADEWFRKYGIWAVFLSRLVPVARSLISLPAGLTRMRMLPFTLLTFAGSFIWSLGLAYGGYILGENWETLRRLMRPLDIPILLTITLVLGIFIYRRIRLRNRSGAK